MESSKHRGSGHKKTKWKEQQCSKEGEHGSAKGGVILTESTGHHSQLFPMELSKEASK